MQYNYVWSMENSSEKNSSSEFGPMHRNPMKNSLTNRVCDLTQREL